MDLDDPLVRAHRRPVDRLLRPRGLRLRRRHAAARSSASDDVGAPGRSSTRSGPVWDGNEVWLIVAGGATFAAFPEWYATLFSGFYLALFLILVALIVRGVAFEYRNKRERPRAGAAAGTGSIVVGSVVPALLWGVAFANIVAGRADRCRQGVHRHLVTLLNPYGAARRAHDAAAVRHARRSCSSRSRSDGSHPRPRGRPRPAGRPGDRGGRRRVPAVGAGDPRRCGVRGASPSPRRSRSSWRSWASRLGREAWAFVASAATIGLAVVSLFWALFPDVMPSSTDPALQPHDDERGLDGLHAHDHDGRGGHLRAHRPGLPGVDVLGVPQAGDGPAGAGRALSRRPRPRPGG